MENRDSQGDRVVREPPIFLFLLGHWRFLSRNKCCLLGNHVYSSHSCWYEKHFQCHTGHVNALVTIRVQIVKIWCYTLVLKVCIPSLLHLMLLINKDSKELPILKIWCKLIKYFWSYYIFNALKMAILSVTRFHLNFCIINTTNNIKNIKVNITFYIQSCTYTFIL